MFIRISISIVSLHFHPMIQSFHSHGDNLKARATDDDAVEPDSARQLLQRPRFIFSQLYPALGRSHSMIGICVPNIQNIPPYQRKQTLSYSIPDQQDQPSRTSQTTFYRDNKNALTSANICSRKPSRSLKRSRRPSPPVPIKFASTTTRARNNALLANAFRGIVSLALPQRGRHQTNMLSYAINSTDISSPVF